MFHSDPREPILAALNRTREERLDADPDSPRYVVLTDTIDELLERLNAMRFTGKTS